MFVGDSRKFMLAKISSYTVNTSVEGWQLKPPEERETRNIANEHQPAQKISSWNPRGDRKQQMSTKLHERWTPKERERDKIKHLSAWKVDRWSPCEERTEIRVLQYKVRRTTVCATAAPTVSTVFHPSQEPSHTKIHATPVIVQQSLPAWQIVSKLPILFLENA